MIILYICNLFVYYQFIRKNEIIILMILMIVMVKLYAISRIF